MLALFPLFIKWTKHTEFCVHYSVLDAFLCLSKSATHSSCSLTTFLPSCHLVVDGLAWTRVPLLAILQVLGKCNPSADPCKSTLLTREISPGCLEQMAFSGIRAIFRSSQSSVEELKDDLSAVSEVLVSKVVSSSGVVYLNN